MAYQRLKNFFKKNFQNYKEQSEDQIYVKCPFCSDRRNHLGINLELKLFHCFRCNISGKLSKLFNLLKVPVISEVDIVQKIIEKNAFKIQNSNGKKSLFEKNRKYIKQGNIDDKIMGELRMFFYEKKINKKFWKDLLNVIKKKENLFGYDYFLKRFLFFSLDNVAVQGRILRGNVPKSIPKYLTYSKNKYFEIYDLNFKNKNFLNVFVVEGPFTALYWYIILKKIKDKNIYIISTLGKSHTIKGVNYIAKKLKDDYKHINIYILLDTDAQKEFLDKYLISKKTKLPVYNNVVYHFILSKYDFGDSGDLLAKYSNYEDIKLFLSQHILFIPFISELDFKINYKKLVKEYDYSIFVN